MRSDARSLDEFEDTEEAEDEVAFEELAESIQSGLAGSTGKGSAIAASLELSASLASVLPSGEFESLLDV